MAVADHFPSIEYHQVIFRVYLDWKEFLHIQQHKLFAPSLDPCHILQTTSTKDIHINRHQGKSHLQVNCIMPWLMKMMPLIGQPLLLQLLCLILIHWPAHHIQVKSSKLLTINQVIYAAQTRCINQQDSRILSNEIKCSTMVRLNADCIGIESLSSPQRKMHTSIKHVAPSPSQAIDFARPCITWHRYHVMFVLSPFCVIRHHKEPELPNKKELIVHFNKHNVSTLMLHIFTIKIRILG